MPGINWVKQRAGGPWAGCGIRLAPALAAVCCLLVVVIFAAMTYVPVGKSLEFCV